MAGCQKVHQRTEPDSRAVMRRLSVPYSQQKNWLRVSAPTVSLSAGGRSFRTLTGINVSSSHGEVRRPCRVERNTRRNLQARVSRGTVSAVSCAEVRKAPARRSSRHSRLLLFRSWLKRAIGSPGGPFRSPAHPVLASPVHTGARRGAETGSGVENAFTCSDARDQIVAEGELHCLVRQGTLGGWGDFAC